MNYIPHGYIINSSIPLSWYRKPENQFNAKGGTSTFVVAATGRGSAIFTWYDPSGQEIPHEYNPYLEIHPITEVSFGVYSVVVRNNYGEEITAKAELCQDKRVIQHKYKLVERKNPYYDLPTFGIICQPVSVNVVLGKRAELSVVVDGDTAKFQWYTQDDCTSFGKIIHGQTYPKFVIDEVIELNCALFYVEVTDVFGQKLQSCLVQIKSVN